LKRGFSRAEDLDVEAMGRLIGEFEQGEESLCRA